MARAYATLPYATHSYVAFQTRDLIQPLVVTPGKDFNSKFGNFKQADFVGVPYGSKVPSRTGRGFLLILRPTPELWTLALPHRTQILYLADIAFITSSLNIKKDSRVIEAGTYYLSSLEDTFKVYKPHGRYTLRSSISPYSRDYRLRNLTLHYLNRYVHHQMTPLRSSLLYSTQRYRIGIILSLNCKNHRLVRTPMVIRIP